MSRVVVTGVAGFIGRHVALASRDRGDEVVGIDLVPARLPGVRDLVADLTEPGDWEPALAGAGLVVHAAAIVAEAGDRRRFVAVNVSGARNVATAAASQGVRRLVHLSSIVVYGTDGPPGAMLEETAPLVPSGGPYTDTKIGAEHAVLSVAAETGLPTTIVRPGDVYGPGSRPWVERPLALLRAGRFPLVDGGRGRLSPVHVDDLVRGILAAGDAEVAVGRAYNLAGPPVPTATFFAHHARHVGVRQRRIPRRIALAGAHLVAVGAGLVGREPPFAPEALEYVTHPCGYATDRARRDLGWAPQVDLADGLVRAFAASPGAGSAD